MIFVTVGTQLAFDRLIRAIDSIAPGLSHPVFAQIGRGATAPQNVESRGILTPQDFEQRLSQCSLVVGHAGIGTLMAAARLRKPMIMFPRRAALGEHRSDHQTETARVFAERSGYYLAQTHSELATQIGRGDLEPAQVSANPSVADLREGLRSFIADAARSRGLFPSQ
jgi:UDP-N-acetylglucosamine transferase subunit ALG13